MPIQTWASVINPPYVADGTALANSAAATDINPAPNPSIPANSLEPGMIFRVDALGKYGTTGTPTLNLGVYYGGVAGSALCTTGAITTPSGVTTQSWRFMAILAVRTIGASGSIFAQGGLDLTTGAATEVTYLAPQSNPAVTSPLDTTTSKAITLGATWGTANASNTITCHLFTVTQLR